MPWNKSMEYPEPTEPAYRISILVSKSHHGLAQVMVMAYGPRGFTLKASGFRSHGFPVQEVSQLGNFVEDDRLEKLSSQMFRPLAWRPLIMVRVSTTVFYLTCSLSPIAQSSPSVRTVIFQIFYSHVSELLVPHLRLGLVAATGARGG